MPGVCHRRLLRAASVCEERGLGAAEHVPHDLPPPSGPCDAAGADLPGIPDSGGRKIPQIENSRANREQTAAREFLCLRRGSYPQTGTG